MIYISQDNSKLGPIPSINLDRLMTCRRDIGCFWKGCYGRKGHFNLPSVKDSLIRNAKAWKANHAKFEKEINDFLNSGLVIYKYFRWFGVGDIPDYSFLKMMMRVAEANPLTKFLAFTKKYELVNIYLTEGYKIPENLNIVFSAWDKEFDVPNPYHLPMSYVNFKNPSRNANGLKDTAFKCKGSCPECLACWCLKKDEQVVFNQH